VKRVGLLTFVFLVGCATPPRAARNYPIEQHEPPPDVRDKDENPQSQAWPLDRWLVEFENRNGVELKYREQDTFGQEVIQPGPGPFDSDQDALDALRRVCRKADLHVVELRPHVYSLRRGGYVR